MCPVSATSRCGPRPAPRSPAVASGSASAGSAHSRPGCRARTGQSCRSMCCTTRWRWRCRRWWSSGRLGSGPSSRVILAVSLAGTLGLTELVMRTRVGRAVFGIPSDAKGGRRLRHPGNVTARRPIRHPRRRNAEPAGGRSPPERGRGVAGDGAPAATGRGAALEGRGPMDRPHLRRAVESDPGHVVRAAAARCGRRRPRRHHQPVAAGMGGRRLRGSGAGQRSSARSTRAKRTLASSRSPAALRPRLLFVEDERQLSRFGDIAPTVVLGTPAETVRRVVTLADFQRAGAPLGTPTQRHGRRAWMGWIGHCVATIAQTIDEEGVSRGAVLTHGNVLHNLEAARDADCRSDRRRGAFDPAAQPHTRTFRHAAGAREWRDAGLRRVAYRPLGRQHARGPSAGDGGGTALPDPPGEGPARRARSNGRA